MKQKEILNNLEKILYRYSSFNRKKGNKLMVGLNARKFKQRNDFYVLVRFEYGIPEKNGYVILNGFKTMSILVSDKRLLNSYYHKVMDVLDNFKEKVKVFPLTTRIFNINSRNPTPILK